MYILELPKTHPGCQDYSISSRESQPKPTKKQPSFATIASWEGNLLQRSLSAAAKEAAAASSPLFLSFGPRIKKIHRFFFVGWKKRGKCFLEWFFRQWLVEAQAFLFPCFFPEFLVECQESAMPGCSISLVYVWYIQISQWLMDQFTASI